MVHDRAENREINSSHRASIPVVGQPTVDLSTTDIERLSKIADRLIHEEPALGASSAFSERVNAGLEEGPALLTSI